MAEKVCINKDKHGKKEYLSPSRQEREVKILNNLASLRLGEQ
ncbi:MAG TPA: hypothetical protein VFX02_04105 [Gammaproteobacteria bacterium]|nr:hypothetical protein [Gammaproteobacteria bacterium]